MTGPANRAWSVTVLMCLLIVMDSTALQGQCSMCRSLLATPEGQRMAAALRSGIWILLAAPFATFAIIVAAAVKRRRRLDEGD
jgi:hypothetical protein